MNKNKSIWYTRIAKCLNLNDWQMSENEKKKRSL